MASKKVLKVLLKVCDRVLAMAYFTDSGHEVSLLFIATEARYFWGLFL